MAKHGAAGSQLLAGRLPVRTTSPLGLALYGVCCGIEEPEIALPKQNRISLSKQNMICLSRRDLTGLLKQGLTCSLNKPLQCLPGQDWTRLLKQDPTCFTDPEFGLLVKVEPELNVEPKPGIACWGGT